MSGTIADRLDLMRERQSTPATADSPNLLVRFAKLKGRDYITPEDISELLSLFPKDNHRTLQDFMEILSHQIDGMGIEDNGLCAFVLWKKFYT